MRKKDIFVGNIMEHVEKSNNIYEKDQVLIKIGRGKYVRLIEINSISKEILIQIKIYFHIMKTHPTFFNRFFIDKETLEPFFPEIEQNKKLNLKTLNTEAGF